MVTSSEELADNARKLRFHGSYDKRTHTEVGYNSRLDAIQATTLRVLLPELDGWNERRRAAADAYAAAGLGELVKLPVPTPGAEHVYHLYTGAPTTRTGWSRGWPRRMSRPAATTACPCIASPRCASSPAPTCR